MFIASEKRKSNIAEYVLYMWQIEDMIRANGLDIDKIRENVIDKTALDEDQRKQLTEWYESLIDMMRREDVAKSGHLQINKNVLASLVELHNALLQDPRFAKYTAEFYKTLPYVVELRAKAGENRADEIETCFNALYGMLMMRISGKEITESTANAIQQIAKFIGTLTAYFHKNEKEDIFRREDDKPEAK